MIDVVYIENKEQLTREDADVILSYVGLKEKNKAHAYRRWQDKQAYLLGKLLLAKLLEEYRYGRGLLKTVTYTEFGRPYIPGATFDFNISHSGEYVVCAFSAHTRVGIDIEQIQRVDLNDFDSILNSADKEIINFSENQDPPFFRIWSAKEAILKADGCGLVNDIFKLEIKDDSGKFNGKVYYLKDLMIHPSYSACLASIDPINEIKVEKTSVEDCIKQFR